MFSALCTFLLSAIALANETAVLRHEVRVSRYCRRMEGTLSQDLWDSYCNPNISFPISSCDEGSRMIEPVAVQTSFSVRIMHEKCNVCANTIDGKQCACDYTPLVSIQRRSRMATTQLKGLITNRQKGYKCYSDTDMQKWRAMVEPCLEAKMPTCSKRKSPKKRMKCVGQKILACCASCELQDP